MKTQDVLIETCCACQLLKLEYGSPVRPQLLEAEVLHHIDLLDAMITMMSNALIKTEPGAFSERVFGLDNRSFYKTNHSIITNTVNEPLDLF